MTMISDINLEFSTLFVLLKVSMTLCEVGGVGGGGKEPSMRIVPRQQCNETSS